MRGSVVLGCAMLAVGVSVGACGGTPDTPSATPSAPASNSTTTAPSNAALGGSFARATPLPSTVNCTYSPTGEAAKPNTPPPTTDVSTQGTVPVAVATSAGDLGLQLDRQLAPCTVNSFLSLAKQNYFNDTPCHRLVTSGIYVLQCGDPAGSGRGGPGYVFGNEYPTDQYPDGDSRLNSSVNYPRGTIAMANTGNPNTNGSQFFLVYGDSPLPPRYTVFGTIDPAGLAVLDKVAAAGNSGSSNTGDGAPKTPVTINRVQASG